MHYSLMGEMRLSFIDSDFLYKGALLCRCECKYNLRLQKINHPPGLIFFYKNI